MRWRPAGPRFAVRVCVVALSALMTAPAFAQLEEFPGVPEPPDLLELHGYIGPPLSGETGGWDLTLGVGFTKTVYDFHLRDMKVLNSGRLSLSILSALEPYQPTFFLFGDAGQLRLLATTSPGRPLVLRGWRRRGSRNFMLTGVVSAAAATPETTATPSAP